MVASVKITATPHRVKVEGESYTGPACSLDVAKVLKTLDLPRLKRKTRLSFTWTRICTERSRSGKANEPAAL